MTDIINQSQSFKAKIQSNSIKQFKECMEKYTTGFDEAKNLNTKLPIFLDTNILLRYYSISFTARNQLFSFIEKNKKRIFITEQVEIEYLRNREDTIKKYFDQVTNKIPKDFTSEILNKITSFHQLHKTVLEDYPYVEPDLLKNLDELKKTLDRLNQDVEKKRNEKKDLLFHDSLVELLCNCKSVDRLTESEIKVIKSDFDLLSKDVVGNLDNELQKGKNAFPGMGDIKEKPSDPYGDFIIYHEILKHMIKNNTDAIFLTFDNTKGDWMKRDKLPHLHYVENTYRNCGNILYILDADRTLESILNVKMDSLIKNESQISLLSQLTIKNLQQFYDSSTIFNGMADYKVNQRLIEELLINGYSSITQLVNACTLASPFALQYQRTEQRHFNKRGLMRACLRIIDPDYKSISRSGNTTVSRDIDLYRAYNLMLSSGLKMDYK